MYPFHFRNLTCAYRAIHSSLRPNTSKCLNQLPTRSRSRSRSTSTYSEQCTWPLIRPSLGKIQYQSVLSNVLCGYHHSTKLFYSSNHGRSLGPNNGKSIDLNNCRPIDLNDGKSINYGDGRSIKDGKSRSKSIDLNFDLSTRESLQEEIISDTLCDSFKTQEKDHSSVDLKSHIIFQDDNLVALNKPYGVSVYGGSNDDLSLSDQLSDLASHLQCTHLSVGLSLKRYYSGVVLLTKSEQATKLLQQFVLQTTAQKDCFMKFLAITVGVPQCRVNEVIEMQFLKEYLHNRELTFVLEEKLSGTAEKSLRNEKRLIKAAISVHVLATNHETESALVQIEVNKWKWDICQVFLSHHLSPVLGDNTYSSRTHYVMGVPFVTPPRAAIPRPQVLPAKISNVLCHNDLEKDDLPLFLHLHKISLCRFPKRKSPGFDIIAHPHPSFLNTLKCLGLYEESLLA